MTPVSATVTSLIVAALVWLALYFWAKLTWVAALAIAAVVGVILQWIMLGTFIADLRNLAGDQILSQAVSQGSIAGLVSLIYLLIIFIVLIVYAARDRQVVPVVIA